MEGTKTNTVENCKDISISSNNSKLPVLYIDDSININ